jgi:hypothetical protein
MGNWRTVEIKGMVQDINEAREIIAYLTVDRKSFESPASNDDIFYLQFGRGLCGLNQWVKSDGDIDVCGNVYERDCEIEDLESELTTLAKKFPSLLLELNAGGDYESTDCVATFFVKNGKVKRMDPVTKYLGGIEKDRVMYNLLRQLMQ